jgi:hypothetical protein
MHLFWLLFGSWLLMGIPAASQPDDPISYVKDIVPIVERTCNVKSCHDGSVKPDLDTREALLAESESIVSRVNDRIIPMPPRYATVSMSAAEKQTLLAWLAADAPDN